MSDEEYVALAREVVANCPVDVVRAVQKEEEAGGGKGKWGWLMGGMMRGGGGDGDGGASAGAGAGEGRVVARKAEEALREVLGISNEKSKSKHES